MLLNGRIGALPCVSLMRRGESRTSKLQPSADAISMMSYYFCMISDGCAAPGLTAYGAVSADRPL